MARPPNYQSQGDFNCDGQVTFSEDFSILQNHYGQVGQVPEPITLVLCLGLGSLGLFPKRS